MIANKIINKIYHLKLLILKILNSFIKNNTYQGNIKKLEIKIFYTKEFLNKLSKLNRFLTDKKILTIPFYISNINIKVFSKDTWKQ